jgi:hypothetical protein
MSMSTPGPNRNPSSVKVDKTSGQGKPPAKSAASRTTAKKTTPGAKGKPRKVVTPVKVNGGRAWGPIIVGGLVGVIAIGIVAWGVIAVTHSESEKKIPWDKRATAISGVVDYRQKYPDLKKAAQHKTGILSYPVSPPVGGTHNPIWQNCMGDVYTAPIPKENAVHSLEHGAVWVTYKQGLDQSDIDTLKSKVQGKDYMFMSPYAGLDKNISLQTWGFQLKVDSAGDPRIDQFIKAVRLNASMEPGAACSSGSTLTGDTPATTAS